MILCQRFSFLLDLDLNELAMCMYMLPSLNITAEKGYEYWVYITYDHGDEFWDKPASVAAMHDWLDANLHAPLNARGRSQRKRAARLREVEGCRGGARPCHSTN